MSTPQQLLKIDPKDKEKTRDVQKAIELLAKYGYEMIIKPKPMKPIPFLFMKK